MHCPELNKIYLGDSLTIMMGWPDNFVHCCVCSPPYWGLRDYGVDSQLGLEKTPEEYIAKMVEVFREVRRVLRDDGTLWLNMGDSYSGSWGNYVAEGSTSTTSMDKRRKERYGIFRPPSADRSVASGIKPKDLVGIPWMLAFALRSDGWYLRSDIIWSKPNPMPESVTDRPTKAHEYLFLLSKSDRYYYDYEAIREPATEASLLRWAQDKAVGGPRSKIPSGWDTGSGDHRGVAGRYKNLPDNQSNIREKRDKQHGHSRRHDGFNDLWDDMSREEQMSMGRNKRTVWTVATMPFKEAHFATFPEKLIEPCILAGSMGGGVVLDPFMGAGTADLVAAKLNRKFLGIEINPKYIEIANRRIAPELAQIKFI